MSKRKSTKIARKCKKCKKKFLVKSSEVKRGGGKFCSRICAVSYRYELHGQSKHPLCSVWRNMVRRCGNPKAAAYRHYGGRGITVCEEWRTSLPAFIAWAEANGYRKGLEIDRRDNDGGYNPENCRWATRLENCRNKRRAAGASKYRYCGVRPHSTAGKWVAIYSWHRSARRLGTFTSEEGAARAWDAFAISQGRERSILNFPREAVAT